MFDEEENNSDFSAERFMGAILRKQREMPWIFGNVRAKEDTTDDGSSTSTLKDIIENQEKISRSEELKKDTTKNGSSSSLIKKTSVGYTYKQRRYSSSDSSMKSFFEERMKNFYKTSKPSKTEVKKEIAKTPTMLLKIMKSQKPQKLNKRA